MVALAAVCHGARAQQEDADLVQIFEVVLADDVVLLREQEVHAHAHVETISARAVFRARRRNVQPARMEGLQKGGAGAGCGPTMVGKEHDAGQR